MHIEVKMTGISVLKDDIDSYGLHLQEDEGNCIKKIASEFAFVKKNEQKPVEHGSSPGSDCYECP